MLSAFKGNKLLCTLGGIAAVGLFAISRPRKASSTPEVRARGVEIVLPAKRFGRTSPPGREHYRVIGSLDVDGGGTLHALASLDPFIFLDESLVPVGAGGLGAGHHPHAGLTAITYLSADRDETKGGAIQAWDNHNGLLTEVNRAGGVYVIQAGRGAVHDEQNVTEEGFMHQLQLWVNPGVHKELPQASARLWPASEVPVVGISDGAEAVAAQSYCRIMVGTQFGVSSPAQTPIPMLYLHVGLRQDETTTLTVPGGYQGFIYVLCGTVSILPSTSASPTSALALPARHIATLTPCSTDATVTLTCPDNEDVQFILAAGVPQGAGGFCKKLGHSGAFIAATEEAVRASLARYEQEKENFGTS